jgi:hypothetical protein
MSEPDWTEQGIGAEVSGRFYFVGLFRDGRLARGEMHLDREEAAAAVARLGGSG